MKAIQIGSYYLVEDFDNGCRPVRVEKKETEPGVWLCRYSDGGLYTFDGSELLIPAEEEDISEAIESFEEELRESMILWPDWDDYAQSYGLEDQVRLVRELKYRGFFLSYKNAERWVRELHRAVNGRDDE